jgi:hypothetical protein
MKRRRKEEGGEAVPAPGRSRCKKVDDAMA